MDLVPVIEALQATLMPQMRKQAEEKLAEVRASPARCAVRRCTRSSSGKRPASSRVSCRSSSASNATWALGKQVVRFTRVLDNARSRLGAILLKNHINAFWSDGVDSPGTTDPDILALADAVNVSIPKVNGDSSKPSAISDGDKDYLRNVLIDAIIRTKDPLR